MPTPMSEADIGIVIRLEPEAAVDYFRAKGYEISWDWQEVKSDVHARGFTVAKATSMDVLTTLKTSWDEAFATGMSEQEWMRQVMPELKRLGWWGKTEVTHENGEVQEVMLGSPHRLRTIYRTNMTTAYQAGRYLQQQALPERPFWQYVAVMDERTRASHGAMNLLVFPADDPIWQTHYPPNDWGCRCRVRAMSQLRLDSLGLTPQSSDGALSVSTVEFGTSVSTGEVYETQVTTFSASVNGEKVSMTPGAGWSYNVGSAAFGTDVAVAQKLVEMEDRQLRQQAIQTLNGGAPRQQAYRDWIAGTLADRVGQAATMPVAMLTDEMATLAGARLATLSREAVVSGTDAMGLAQADYEQLPALLAEPDAVLRDDQGQLVLVGSATTQGDALLVRLANPYSGSVDAEVQVQRDTLTQVATDVTQGRYTLIQGQLPEDE